MTAFELKASLINSIQAIDDESVISRISRYVEKTVKESRRDRLSKSDLVVNPIALEIIKDLNGGPAIDDKAEMHQHWEEKYK